MGVTNLAENVFRRSTAGPEDVHKPLLSEFVALSVARFGQSVREQDHDISGPQVHGLLDGDALKKVTPFQSNSNARRLEHIGRSIGRPVNKKRAMPRPGESHATLLHIEHAISHGRKHTPVRGLAEHPVHVSQCADRRAIRFRPGLEVAL